MKKDKIYKCKDCDKEIKVKSVTPMLILIKLCHECFRDRSIKEYKELYGED